MGSFYATGLSSFPCTHAAVGLLRHHFRSSIESFVDETYIPQLEDEMLGCLFSISVLIQESISILSSGDSTASTGLNTLGELENSLRDSRPLWWDSIHNLRSILYESVRRLFEQGEYKVNYITDMVHVLSTLSLEARRGVEKCLINLLYCLGDNNNDSDKFLVDDGWSPDSLLSSMHGH